MKNKLLLLFFITTLSVFIFGSCANMGMPEGGPIDSLPPIVLKTFPEQGTVNFKGDRVYVEFDEYVAIEDLTEKLVISPPMQSPPTPQMRGKGILLKFDEELKDSVTYSIDFKDGIADYNEGNKYPNLRLNFSTGNTLDSLRLAGFVKNAKNLEPVPNVFVFLYRTHLDTIYRTIPDFVAKTNDAGVFLFDGLPQDTFEIYAVDDLDKGYTLNYKSEQHAFLDSMLIPSAKFFPDQDTTVSGQDTLLVYGKTRFFPEPICLFQHEEKVLLRSLEDSKRNERRKFNIIFSQGVEDTFDIKPVNFDWDQEELWYYMEASVEMDTLNFWITDTLLAKNDSLEAAITYFVPDSLYNPKIQTDTIELYFKDPFKVKKRPKHKRRSEVKIGELDSDTIPSFQLITKIPQKQDVNKKLTITADDPILPIDKKFIHLNQVVDSIETDVPFTWEKDSISRRKYYLNTKWEFEGNYHLTIDSAATSTIYGDISKPVDEKIEVQEEAYYGKIILDIKNVKDPLIIQLINADEDETIVRSINIDKDELIEFRYLAPNPYGIKVIYDLNKNGIWDTGNFEERTQPERVAYFPEKITIRSNWDNVKEWTLGDTPSIEKPDLKEPDEQENEKEDNTIPD